MVENKIVVSTDLKEIRFFKRGKVRDVYDLGDSLLIVATDRISAFDVVMSNCIPSKGKILTTISVFWFEFTKDIIPNHFITADVNNFPEVLAKYKEILKGRSMLVRKTKPIPVECVVRGYLSGSAWKEYTRVQSICGIKLAKGFKESDKLPEPIFTPATKEEIRHDINVTQEYIEKELGKTLATRLKDISIAVYKKASEYTETNGIIIADTKFEFGRIEDEIILIDEVLTPDSSRFWPKTGYIPGKSQPSFDKQFVRDYFESLNWDKTPPAPELPEEIVNKTTEKYLQVLEMIVGSEL